MIQCDTTAWPTSWQLSEAWEKMPAWGCGLPGGDENKRCHQTHPYLCWSRSRNHSRRLITRNPPFFPLEKDCTLCKIPSLHGFILCKPLFCLPYIQIFLHDERGGAICIFRLYLPPSPPTEKFQSGLENRWAMESGSELHPDFLGEMSFPIMRSALANSYTSGRITRVIKSIPFFMSQIFGQKRKKKKRFSHRAAKVEFINHDIFF